MAYTITLISPEIRAHMDGFAGRIGRSMDRYFEVRSRRDQVEALEAKSDEELSRMGLTRDRIVAHVFRDVLWL